MSLGVQTQHLWSGKVNARAGNAKIPMLVPLFHYKPDHPEQPTHNFLSEEALDLDSSFNREIAASSLPLLSAASLVSLSALQPSSLASD